MHVLVVETSCIQEQCNSSTFIYTLLIKLILKSSKCFKTDTETGKIISDNMDIILLKLIKIKYEYVITY